MPIGLVEIVSHCHNWHPLGFAQWVIDAQWVNGKSVTVVTVEPNGHDPMGQNACFLSNLTCECDNCDPARNPLIYWFFNFSSAFLKTPKHDPCFPVTLSQLTMCSTHRVYP